MNLDITAHKGRRDKPAVVFIHGLGLDKRIWAAPDEARMLAGRFPIKLLLSKKAAAIDYGTAEKRPEIKHNRFSIGEAAVELKTSFSDLQSLGYSVIAWSQKRPAGPIAVASSELREVIKLSAEHSRAGLILIGHSRGGLIARKYLENKDKSIRGLITLASPHCGSTMAKWAEHLAPVASVVSRWIQEESKKKVSYTIKRILDFVGSKAIKELLPDSEFFRSLKDYDSDRIYGLSFGGTNPSLFTLYRWRLKKIARRDTSKWLLEPRPLFTIPDILAKIFPKKIYPIELRKGYGDGLVSAKSSVLPEGREHYNFSINHAAILFDERVRNKIIEAIAEM